MLVLIGQVAVQVEAGGGWARIGSTPVPLHCLPYLALLSIEHSNDYRGDPPTWAHLVRAIEMFLTLETPISRESDLYGDDAAGKEFLLRLGLQQFEYWGELRHLLPRTLLILRDLWPTVVQASKVVPTEVVKAVTGNDLVQNVAFGVVVGGAAKSGWFKPYTSSPNKAPIKDILSMEAQSRFLDWISADYRQIRNAARQVILDETWDVYRFNPLLHHPLVRPDRQSSQSQQAYLVPVGRLVYQRSTRGLYHVLTSHHDCGEGENPFRVAFGYVFQEYVGVLLGEAFGRDRVLNEWKYGPSASQKATPDWIVLDGNRAILIEVKQSGLTLGSKLTGSLEHIRRDLRKTIAKAEDQLNKFEADVRQGARGLERLTGVMSFERLVVTWDRVFWCNSILREEIDAAGETSSEQRVLTHAHVLTIEDLEYLLGYCWHGSLFALLQQKRLGPDSQDSMDFHDWMNLYLFKGEERCGNPFLSQKFSQYLEEWGLPPVGDAHD
jgi:hypothetical protein